jgi:O-antigen ligase
MYERYELRNLEERSINEEQRYFEYKLLYDDVFKYKRYSPWIGFDLFNSPGNYGGGKFYDRSLHGDITSIGHSSGLIGIALYFMMIITAFLTAFRSAAERSDKLTVLFCGITFFSYCLTGRFTQVGSMLMIFLIAMIPVALPVEVSETTLVEEPEDLNHANALVLNATD